MKKSTFIFISILLMLTATQGILMAAWNGYYPTEADEVPTSSNNWYLDQAAYDDPITGAYYNGLARIDTDNESGTDATTAWLNTSPGLNVSTGFTVDFRLQNGDTTESSTTSGCSFLVQVDDKFKVIIHVFGKVGTDEQASRLGLIWTTSSTTESTVYTPAIGDRKDLDYVFTHHSARHEGLHTWRFVVKDDTYAVYVDDLPGAILTGSIPAYDPDSTRVGFGDMDGRATVTSTVCTGTSRLDWLIWDNSEAMFAPPIRPGATETEIGYSISYRPNGTGTTSAKNDQWPWPERWTMDNTSGTDPITSITDGIVSITTNNTNTTVWSYDTLDGSSNPRAMLDLSSGYSVDFRFKDETNSASVAGNAFKIAEDGEHAVIISVLGKVGTDDTKSRLKLVWCGNGPTEYSDSFDDLNDFHDYRVTFHKDKCKIYVDDQPTPIYDEEIYSSDPDATYIAFGDYGTSVNGNAKLDYISWTLRPIWSPIIKTDWGFDDGYDPQTSTDTPGTGWYKDTYQTNADPISSVTSTGIAQISTDNSTTTRWVNNQTGLDSDKGYTIDFRVKDQLNSTQNTGCAFTIVDDDEFKLIVKVLSKVNTDDNLTRLELVWSGASTEYSASIPDRDDFDGYHTFRFTFHDGQYAIYADDQLEPIIGGDLPTGLTDPNTTCISFGDWGTSTNGSALLDYIVWDNTQAIFASPIRPEYSDLTRGHQLFLKNGIQLVSNAPWAAFSNGFSLSTWENAGYTTLDIANNNAGDDITDRPDHYDYGVSQGDLSATNTKAFKYWFSKNLMADPCSEKYLHNLIFAKYSDENQSPLDTPGLPKLTDALNAVKIRFPEAFSYTNQSFRNFQDSDGDDIELTVPMYKRYVQTCKPDMLCLTQYDFLSEGTFTLSKDGDTEEDYGYDYHGGSPAPMYHVIAMARKAAMAGHDGTGRYPIPFGMYTQTFGGEAGSNNNRLPTESEYNLQQFAGLAFGMKYTCAYPYHTKATNMISMFFSESNDAEITNQGQTLSRLEKYAEMLDEAKNLGDALVNLISTDVYFVPGEHICDWVDCLVEPVDPVPNHHEANSPSNPQTIDNPIPFECEEWDVTNDPSNSYIYAVTVTNNGSKNDGKDGDAIIGYFKPLTDKLAQPAHEDDVYFMVVNGLSAGIPTNDPNSVGVDYNAAACEQKIRLYFDFTGTSITHLLEVDREHGCVHRVAPTLLTGETSKYYYDVILDGGKGNLYKYDTGDAFLNVNGLNSICTTSH